MLYSHTQSAARLAVLGLLVLGAAGCRDVIGPDPEPEIAAVRLTFTLGASSPTVTIEEGQANASITLPAGTTEALVSAEWLDDEGQLLTAVTTAEFELRITGRPFAAISGAFAGTISGLVTGSNNVIVQAWHIEEDHEDFEVELEIIVSG